MSRFLGLLIVVCLLNAVTLAGETFNPPPTSLEIPQQAEAVARLNETSGGKTPTVKEIKPEWIRRLAERGEPVVLTKENSANFAYLGMPIGGIGAGELYLGGDGRLWNWDVLNTNVAAGFPVEGGLAYVKPHELCDPNDPGQIFVKQGFVLKTVSDGKSTTHTLDRDGFSDIRFTGEYPIGYVNYATADCPVTVQLEAFSPFVPGVVEDSTYPATVLNYTLTNPSQHPVTCELAGWMQNVIGVKSQLPFDLDRQNAITSGANFTTLSCTAAEAPKTRERLQDKIFEDFESGTYDNWKVEGTVFGTHPDNGSPVPGGKPPRGFMGKFLVSGFASTDADAKGKLTSPDFVISESFITFLIAGGNFPGQECVNLVIDGKVVDTATGRGGPELKPVYWKVEHLIGKTAHLEIVDNLPSKKVKWPHILVDQFVFTESLAAFGAFADQSDIGTMSLTALGDPKDSLGSAQLATGSASDAAIQLTSVPSAHVVLKNPDDDLVGGVKRSVTIAPGEKTTITFLVSWYFPRPLSLGLKTPMDRQYAKRFKSAAEVSESLASDLPRLTKLTRLWHDTWYDSTLPHWFLDRTFANVSTLATATTYLLSDGRFYGYEGCYSCPGTCTHVYGYQQAVGFLFPTLEKALLEKVEFNPTVGMNAQGGVAMRAEFDKNPPVDGQAGIIMRSYLVHRMSADDAFLKANYPSIKQAMGYLVDQYDTQKKGILEGNQRNTMDAGWFGEIAWLSLYYQSSLLATAQMADRMNDVAYAASLRALAAKGRDYVETQLFNGEFYYHKGDADHMKSPGTYIGCHIDQLMGQNWADETGLGEILDPVHEKTALDSIWKYNFTTRVGDYRKQFTGGRNYARADDSAVIMCTFPLGGEDALKKGLGSFAAYMNESWAGCEHELAATMMWQGMVDRSLAIEKAIDERYAGSVRNPWDECECGSHYSRSMSSYGVFTAASGFEYDGPTGYIAFAPRVNPENFKAAFTSAAGWGSFSQVYADGGLDASITIRFGKLDLKSVALVIPTGCDAKSVSVNVGGKELKATSNHEGTRVLIQLDGAMHLDADQTLAIKIR